MMKFKALLALLFGCCLVVGCSDGGDAATEGGAAGGSEAAGSDDAGSGEAGSGVGGGADVE